MDSMSRLYQPGWVNSSGSVTRPAVPPGATLRSATTTTCPERVARPVRPTGQGVCESCSHAKQAPGWSARPTQAPTFREDPDPDGTPIGPPPRHRARRATSSRI